MPTTNRGALVPTVGTAGRGQQLVKLVHQRFGFNPRQMGDISPNQLREMIQREKMSDLQVQFAQQWDESARKQMANTQKIEEMVQAFLKDASASIEDIAQRFTATNEESALLQQKLAMLQAGSETKIAGIDAETRGYVSHQDALAQSSIRSIALKYKIKMQQLGRADEFRANSALSADQIDADRQSLQNYLNGGDLKGNTFNPYAGALAGASKGLGVRTKRRHRRASAWAS